jgi:hypothetical protein
LDAGSRPNHSRRAARDYRLSHTARNIAESTRLALTLPPARLEANRSPRRGNTAPRSVFPSSRTFIRKLRILDGVEFLEAPTFTALVTDYLEDDEYRALQLFLAEDPEAGDVIPGTGGFRKLRWADRRRRKGKRGGLR